MVDRRILRVVLGMVAAVLTVGAAAPAEATGRATVVRTTIDIPALVLDNLCNADVVALSGDLVITTITTPAGKGGYTVRSSAVARQLRGSRIAPLPAIGYRGSDGEHTTSYFAPPPHPSTHEVVHWTTLIPEGNAPRMYLALYLLEIGDGAMVPVFERAALTCRQPGRA